MCGRYLIDDEVYADLWMTVSAAADNIGSALRAEGSAFAPGEVFPSNIAPVITCAGASFAKWGFAHWKSAGVIINARAETALQKAMFRKPLMERRCVVPSAGFYEWDRTGALSASGNPGAAFDSKTGKGARAGKKDKYLLRRPGEHMLFMAGMTDIFRGADGLEYIAFAILTTAANSSMQNIHDRMPVILLPDERDMWINDEKFFEYAIRRTCPPLELARSV